MYIFRPDLYAININQIAGVLQALQIGFPEEIMKQLPAGIAQHFVKIEDPKPELVVDNDDVAEDALGVVPIPEQESPATDNVVELSPEVTGDDIAELIKDAEEFSDPPK